MTIVVIDRELRAIDAYTVQHPTNPQPTPVHGSARPELGG